MFMGYVITDVLYKKFVRHSHDFRVIWVKEELLMGKQNMEDFYMQLNPDKIVFVCCDNVAFVNRFVKEGVLMDLTSFSLESNLLEFVRATHYSNEQYRAACNELRDVIASEGEDYRVCGPEKECLFNRNMIVNASEMVGLYEDGTYISHQVDTHLREFSIEENRLNMDFVGEMYLDIQMRFEDLGQRKLASLFLGFASNRPILYIGASPGDSWMYVLSKLKLSVLAMDPRALSRMSEDMIRDKRIVFIQDKFSTWKDERLKDFISRPFDLIWDVRSDYENDEQYDALVRAEIAQLNEVIESMPSTCIRASVKIQASNVRRYRLPVNGRLFLLPWCIEREKYETRYVFRNCDTRIILPFSECVCQYVDNMKIRKEFCGVLFSNPAFSNFSLFYNAMLQRYDFANYIDYPRLSSWDLNLFTVNRNEPERMVKYLTDAIGIISFFSHERLSADEHRVPYHEVLNRFTVADTRVFIGRKLAHLYILIPKNVKVFTDELLTSNCYSIKRIGSDMLSKFGYHGYHEAKRAAALEQEYVFARFPEPFSVMDKLCTPSGHAMRIAYDSIVSDGYEIFSYFDKIVYSFYMHSAGAKRQQIHRYCESKAPTGFPTLKKIVKRVLEKPRHTVWHSLVEWRAGIRAAEIISSDKRSFLTLFDAHIVKIKRLVDGLVGDEMYRWNNEMNVGKLTPRYIAKLQNIMLAEVESEESSDSSFDQHLNRAGLDTGRVTDGVQILHSKYGNRIDVHGNSLERGKMLFATVREEYVDFLIVNFRLDSFARGLFYIESMMSVLSRGKTANAYSFRFKLSSMMIDNLVYQHEVKTGGFLKYGKPWETPLRGNTVANAVYFLLACEWVNMSTPVEIFYPARNTNWLRFIDEQDIDIVIAFMRRTFNADDFFLLEDARVSINNDTDARGLRHP